MNKLNLNIKELEFLYKSGLKLEKIATYFNSNRVTIRKYINKNNFAKRKRAKKDIRKKFKHSYNENYFKEINTFDKAYFLGLMYADGCNTRVGMSIGLQEKDSYILNKFKEKLEYSGNLLKNKKLNFSDVIVLSITNLTISENLSLSGCIPAKSKILVFPSEEILPKHLQSHFIRGYFDGDGCINVDKRNNSYNISIIGTPEFLNKIQEILMENCNLNKTKLNTNKVWTERTANLRYGGNLQVKRIGEWLYKDCEDLYIARKKEKFDKVNTLN